MAMDRKYHKAELAFTRAIIALATGPGNMRARLPSVYPILAVVSSHDLPETLREDFDWIMQKLTAREPRFAGPTVWETTADASVARMRTNTAVKVAQRIAYISERLRSNFSVS